MIKQTKMDTFLRRFTHHSWRNIHRRDSFHSVMNAVLPLEKNLWQKHEGEPSSHTVNPRPPQLYSEVQPCSPSRPVLSLDGSASLLSCHLASSLWIVEEQLWWSWRVSPEKKDDGGNLRSLSGSATAFSAPRCAPLLQQAKMFDDHTWM